MKQKRIAIIGAGLSGLATAWFLSKKQEFEITLFDPGQIGDNASGLAAGLLHPYPGAHSKLVRDGMEGYQTTLELAEIASAALGKSVIESTGILRVAITEEQQADFRACSDRYPDVDWLNADECQKVQPGLVAAPGILIKSGKLVDTTAYLLGLWKACEAAGVRWEQRKISSLSELSEYNYTIIATGAETTSIPELSNLPIRPVKGQLLEVEWPTDLPPIQTPINSKAYILPKKDPSRCIVGATFERNFNSPNPDLSVALKYLKPKMTALFPQLENARILTCRSGIRASTPDHFPMVNQVSPSTWVITGMGSKGLLYHGLYAKGLVEQGFHH